MVIRDPANAQLLDILRFKQLCLVDDGPSQVSEERSRQTQELDDAFLAFKEEQQDRWDEQQDPSIFWKTLSNSRKASNLHLRLLNPPP